jgi:hypothetical protein
MYIDDEEAKLQRELDHLYTLNRLEPNICARDGECEIELSKAISQKRIADALERRTPGEVVRDHHTNMVKSLGGQHWRRLTLSQSIKVASDYFAKLTGVRLRDL